jgi:DNA-binding response OmpR family regulator
MAYHPNRVLLVDDDHRLAAALVAALNRIGYHVRHVSTGMEALSAPSADLVLLDLNLPDGDGVDLCRQLRRERDVGIIMLSGRCEQNQRIAGLRSGADDYVVKPFSFVELRARMEAVLRRVRSGPGGTHVVGDLVVDFDQYHAVVAGTPVRLTRTEFLLLAALVTRPDEVVSREALLIEVWSGASVGSSRTLDVHMAALRAKIGGARIETVRSVGYRLLSRPPTDA